MTCLQIYQELLSLVTFLQAHSNSKVVFYLSWQNTYLNFKTACHIKLKFFLWTTLLENLLLVNYLISVPATLNIIKSLISKALIDNEISYEDFTTIIDEQRNYRELKESIKMMKSQRSEIERNKLIERTVKEKALMNLLSKMKI